MTMHRDPPPQREAHRPTSAPRAATRPGSPGVPGATDAGIPTTRGSTRPWAGAARPLSAAALAAAAKRIGCDEAAIHAVWEVESTGRHYLPDGTVTRRFEPHHFPREHWQAIGFRPGNAAAWRASLRLPKPEREAMFLRAVGIDREAALRAASWGAPQIMGFNAGAAGHDSAGGMVAAMAESADAQLAAFIALVTEWGLDAAIRAHDWQTFARRYNGSGRVEHYARRMETAYRRHAGARSPRVLRVGDRGAAVRRLQDALGIAADGAFGPETLARVNAFQQHVGLPVDGVVGARTWSALERLTQSRAPVQESMADPVLDNARRLSGAAAAVSAMAAAIGEFRSALPDGIFTYAAYAALACALLFATSHAVKRVRS